ncbi:hypothetical protein E2C01_044517 [Portunus trituberculatus]|uniref:Uncharacterized protein n=1 Tax=Portunus trituberculatus TaxID=210409 RepID=A0A5B7G0N5_PORTR|nr:hypothetical protein [Portunus trituberculatus]
MVVVVVVGASDSGSVAVMVEAAASLYFPFPAPTAARRGGEEDGVGREITDGQWFIIEGIWKGRKEPSRACNEPLALFKSRRVCGQVAARVGGRWACEAPPPGRACIKTV